jgi:hypothetical protein
MMWLSSNQITTTGYALVNIEVRDAEERKPIHWSN